MKVITELDNPDGYCLKDKRPVCNECEQRVELVVEVGEEDNYESATAWLCVSCLRKALLMGTTAQTE